MPLTPRSDKGYLVPDNPSPTEFDYRVIKIPTDPQWRETYSYLVGLLTFGYVWDKDSGDYEAAIATAMDILNCFIGLGIDCMTICEIVADCIVNDATTQAAIATAISSSQEIQSAIEQIIVNNGSGQGYPLSPLPSSIMANSIIPAGALCTNDNKYAMARAIVQQLDTLATDFLEIIALISNRAEIASEMIEAIPIFGGLASLALDVADWVTDNVKDTYAASYNSTTEVDYSCAIYNAFVGCELSWDNVIAVYEEQSSIVPPVSENFVEIMQWFVVNVVGSTDNIIVGSMHLFILNALKFGSNWVGSGVWTALEIAVEDAKDEEISVPPECETPPPATTPIFDPNPPIGGGAGGVNLTDLGGGQWIATSTTRTAGDAGVAIKASDNGTFRVSGQSRSTMTSAFWGYQKPDLSFVTGYGNPPNNIDMINLIWTWSNTYVGATITFTFLDA